MSLIDFKNSSTSDTQLSLTTSNARKIFHEDPIKALIQLKDLGFKEIHECGCAFFSRKKNALEPDCRNIIETELPLFVKKKFTSKKKLITVCSIASGRGFQDLRLISQFADKGYKNLRWILVDRIFARETGKKVIYQFSLIAKKLSPRIKIAMLSEIDDIEKTKLVADIFFAVDYGAFYSNEDNPLPKIITSFEKYLCCLSNPVIYIKSEKTIEDNVQWYKGFKITRLYHMKLSLEFFSNQKDLPNEKRILVDCDLPSGIFKEDESTDCSQQTKIVVMEEL